MAKEICPFRVEDQADAYGNRQIFRDCLGWDCPLYLGPYFMQKSNNYCSRANAMRETCSGKEV